MTHTPSETRRPHARDARDGRARPAPGSNPPPDLAVVIPCFNGLAFTRPCVESLRRHTRMPHEIVIVDNGSADGTAAWAEGEGLVCFRNERNRGFAAACNQGILATHGDYVILLNNDTLVTPRWAERLVAHVQAEPAIGIAGPSTNYANNEQRIAPCPYTDEQSLRRFSDSIYRRNRGARVELPCVIGFCMLLTRRLIQDVGLLDERFGLGNFEDNDLCRRARIAGFKVVWAKDVFVHHHGGQCFKQNRIDYHSLIEKNLALYRQKWSAAGAPQDAEKTCAAPPDACGVQGPSAVPLRQPTEQPDSPSQA